MMQDLRAMSKIPELTLPHPLYPESQRNYEYRMQSAAGVEPTNNFTQTREQVAEELRTEDAEIYNKALEENMVSGELSPEEAIAFDSVYEAPERTANTSLETKAAQNEMAEALQWEPGLAITVGLNPEDFNEEPAIKQILYTRFKENMESFFADGSLWEVVPGLISLSQPGVSNLAEQLPGHFDLLYTSKKDTWDKLMNEAYEGTPEDFARYLEGLSKYLSSLPKAEAMDLYYRGTQTKDYGENVFTLVDVISLGAASAAKAAGNVSKSTGIVAKAIKDGSKAAKIEEGLPTAIKAQTKKMSFHNSVAHEMSDGLVVDILDRVVEASRATPVVIDEKEMELLRETARAKVFKNAAPSVGDPVDFLLPNDAIVKGDSGEWIYHAVFGPYKSGEAGGFHTKKLADNFAKRMGLEQGEYSIYKPKGDGSGYYVDVAQGLSEDVLRTVKTDDIAEFTSGSGVTGWFNRMLSGSTLRSAEEHARATEITRKASVVTDKLSEHILRLKPTKEDYKVIEQLYREGHEAVEGMGKWFSEKDLIAKGISEKHRQLYKAYKEVNDTAYAIINDSAVRSLTAQGFGMDKEGRIVREIKPESVTHDMYDRMVVMTDAQKLTPNNISGAKALQMIKEGDYKLYEIHTSYINANLLDYNYVLVKAEDAGIGPLNRFILNYQEGGPRAYQFGTNYIKAGRAWYADGAMINAHPVTLLAETNEKLAKEAAEEYGKLWDVAKKYMDMEIDEVDIARELEQLELKHLNVNSPDELIDLIRTDENPGGILDISSSEYRPRLVKHGEEIIYNNGRRSVANPTGVWDDPQIELVNNNWRFGKSRRTKLLRDIYNKPAAMKSFDEMTARSIQKAANAGVMSDYKRYMESGFRRNFASVVDTLGGKYNVNGVSDTTLIKTAKILPESAVAGEEAKALTRAAKRWQDVYNIVTNVKTEGDKVIHEGMVKLAEKLSKRGWVSPEFAEMISETDPSKSIRALHFSAAMGFWNSAQAWKQMLGTVSAFAMHPVDCTRAMMAYVPIRAMYRYKDTSPALYKAFRKTAGMMGGYSERALDAFMDYMDEFGTLSSLKRLPGVDEARVKNNMLTKLWNSSYFFTEMGTNFNYGVTDTMAFMDKFAKKGGRLSKIDMRDIAARADDLYINMSRQTQSKLQKSTIGSWFTQWLSYPMRMIESQMNRRLSLTERLQISAAQFSMWGIGGTLLDEETSLMTYDWLTNDMGMDDETANYVVNGFVTYWGREAGREIHEGLNVLDMIKNQLPIYKLFTDNEVQMPRVPAANFWGIIGSTYSAIHDILLPPTGDFDLLTYIRGRAIDKTLPTGLRNASKAAVMFAVNRAYNNAGELIKKDATTRDAVYQLLGVGPSEGTEMYNIKLWENMEEEAIKGFIEDIKPYIDQWNMIDINNKIEDREEIANTLRDLNNTATEKFKIAYTSLRDTWGDAVAERFARAYQRLYLGDGDEDTYERTSQRMYLMSPKKFETIKSYMGKGED